MAKEGLKGVFYRKYHLSMCTYCSGVNGIMLSAIRYAWKGHPWEGVEVLTGKSMQPTPGMKKTILVGKCIYKAHKDNPEIREMIAVKGCPPKPRDLLGALDAAEARRAVDDYREYFSRQGLYENSVYEGIPALLRELRESGRCVCLATSKPTVFAERILEHFDLARHFDLVVGSHLDGTRVAKAEIVATSLAGIGGVAAGRAA